jgi:internalin A
VRRKRALLLKLFHTFLSLSHVSTQVLDVSSNALENLPQSIGRLTSLQTLNVDNNRLSSLPPIQLKKLVSLSAAGNKLSTLPASIAECLALTMIDLRDNPLLQSVSIAVSKLPNLVNYMHDEIKTVQKKV